MVTNILYNVTLEPPYKGHLETRHLVLYKNVPLFLEVKMYCHDIIIGSSQTYPVHVYA